MLHTKRNPIKSFSYQKYLSQTSKPQTQSKMHDNEEHKLRIKHDRAISQYMRGQKTLPDTTVTNHDSSRIQSKQNSYFVSTKLDRLRKKRQSKIENQINKQKEINQRLQMEIQYQSGQHERRMRKISADIANINNQFNSFQNQLILITDKLTKMGF